jgi:DNA-binding response OmpR family regulator
VGASILWIVEPDAALRPILAAAVDGMLPEACVAETLPGAPVPLGALVLSLRAGEDWPAWLAGQRVPVVALVAKGETRLWPAGWEVLEKPLHPASVRGALRRALDACTVATEALALPGGSLLLTQRLLRGPDGEARLTEKEVALLRYLLRAAAPVPRPQLLAEIWGYQADTPTRTVETHLYRLRRKIDGLGLPLALVATGDGIEARVG